MTADFYSRWVWPAGGSGGIWGDVVGSLLWVVMAGAVTALLWPRIRHAIEGFVKRHAEDVKAHITAHHDRHAAELAEVRRRLDHIIEFHPDIPDLPPHDQS